MAGGSSPLARGTHPIEAIEAPAGRFIPAGAGNTPAVEGSAARRAVHPRWRGEHPASAGWSLRYVGSSPLARGTHVEQVNDLAKRRFIPAGAGNTERPLRLLSWMAVHPRWRGEHAPFVAHSVSVAGSSPLARGTHRLQHAQRRHARFIPAGAGNTPPCWIGSGACSVHPRWRGEHCGGAVLICAHYGSSPLARGTRDYAGALCCQGRFIPAGAGNTADPAAGREGASVHPRWRGEHAVWSVRSTRTVGSSPLARGTLDELKKDAAPMRFIPAGAGNTRPARRWR